MRLIIVDRTGRARCALWDRHVDVALRAGNLQGRIIRVGHAYTRQGLAGDTEVHAGERSSIEIDPPSFREAEFPEFHELFTPVGMITSESVQVNTIGVIELDPRFYKFTKDDRQGAVMRTVLADESGSVPLVLWNEMAEKFRELRKGDLLQIINARTRVGNDSRLELHAESRSQITLLANPPEYFKPPTMKEQKTYQIAELTPKLRVVDLNIIVLEKGEPREVKRPSGESVKVASLVIADETGIASISLWDDKAERVRDFEAGEALNLRSVSVTERMGEIRLSLGKSGEVVKTGAKQDFKLSITPLNGLGTAKGLLIVEGDVADEPLVRQVVTERGESVNVASFNMRDNTGSAKVTFWRDQVEAVAKLHPGARVRIIGVRVRPGLGGQLELSTIPLSKLERVERPPPSKPAWEDIRHVIALEPGLETWIKGVVIEPLEDARLSAVCDVCEAPLTLSEGKFSCDACKAERAGRVIITGRLKVDDGTGAVNVVIEGINAELLIPADVAAARTQMQQESTTKLQLSAETLSALIGKQFEIYGKAEPGDAQTGGKLVFKAMRLLIADKM